MLIMQHCFLEFRLMCYIGSSEQLRKLYCGLKLIYFCPLNYDKIVTTLVTIVYTSG